MKEGLQFIPVKEIRESKTNPRKYFDPLGEAEIQENIRSRGLKTPILVRPKGDGYELVDGARRLRAMIALGADKIEVIVKPLTDEEAHEIQLISFTQKADIHPLDEAVAYNELLRQKFDIPTISAKVGKPRAYVTRRLQLTKLIEPAKEALREKWITLGHALEICRLQEDLQAKALKATTNKYDPLGIEELRDWISREVLANLDKAPFDLTDAGLLEKVGPCATCPKRSGSNPDLFGDIGKGNICTDPTCYALKVKAFIANKEAQLKEEGSKVRLISSHWQPDRKTGGISTDKYDAVPKREATAVGIITDGDRAGEVIGIRLKGEKVPEKGKQPGAKKTEPSPERKRELYKRRLEIHENRTDQAERLKTYQTLLLRLRWPVSRKDFEILVGELMLSEGRHYGNEHELLAKSIGLKDLPDIGFSDEPDYKNLAKLSDQQLVQIAFGIALEQEMIDDPLSHIPSDIRLAALCSRHGVDRKAARELVAKERAAKAPKPPVIVKPKKAKKAAKKPAKKGKG